MTRATVRCLTASLFALAVLAGCSSEPAATARPTQVSDEPDLSVYERYFPGQPGGVDLVVSQMLWGWDRTGPYGWVNRDKRTEHTVVRDNKRVTLDVGDPEVTIWLFGGSTAFGVGQRQDHTIASRLVALARERDVRLQVVNHGVSGYVNWQEAAWFADELASGQKPDIAVFLDGANDTALAIEREAYGLLDPAKTYSLSMEDAQREALAKAAKARGYRPAGDLEQAAMVAAAQYRRGADRAREAGSRAGVRVELFWQPQLYTMPLDRPLVRAALKQWEIDPEYQQEVGAMARRLAELSGAEPFDLTHVLDDVTGPVFFDQSHSNEYGADIVARAMFDRLWPQILEAR